MQQALYDYSKDFKQTDMFPKVATMAVPIIRVRGVVMDDDGNIEKVILRANYQNLLPQIRANLGHNGNYCRIYEVSNNGFSEWEMEMSGDNLNQILSQYSVYGHLRTGGL